MALTADGVNLAGVRRILQLQEQARRPQAELGQLKTAARGAPAARPAGTRQPGPVDPPLPGSPTSRRPQANRATVTPARKPAPARPRRRQHFAPAGRRCPVTGWGRGCRGPRRRRLPGPAPGRWPGGGPGRCRCRVRTGSTPAGAYAAGNRTARAPAPGCPLTSPSFIALNVNSTSVAAGSPGLCHASG
jgi:hypothetical protein